MPEDTTAFHDYDPGPWTDVEPLMQEQLRRLEHQADHHDEIPSRGGWMGGYSGVDDLALQFEEADADVLPLTPVRGEVYRAAAFQLREDARVAYRWLRRRYQLVRGGPVGDAVVKAYVWVAEKLTSR